MDSNYISQLQAILQSESWSQQQLAERLGITHAALNRWLKGRAIPQPRRRQAIALLYRELIGFQPLLAAQRRQLAARAQGLRIRGLWKKIRESADLLDELLLEHTYNSNAIEGSTLTKKQTEAIIFDKSQFADKSLVEHLEATNHAAVLREILLGYFPMPVSEGLIRQLHRALLQGIREDAGFYSKHERAIRGVGIALTHPKDIPEEMAGLLKRWRPWERRGDAVQPVAQFHADFELIHPFGDGNGRVGRLVMLIQLLKRDYPPVIIENTRKAEYYEVLEFAQRKSVEPFTVFLLDEMERTHLVLRQYLR
jgi:Fic family protein